MDTAVFSRNQLTPLGERIFLDRYALKDMQKIDLAVGDLVVVQTDSVTGQREVGNVDDIYTCPNSGVLVKVRLRDDTLVEESLEHVDRPLETTVEQLHARVAKGAASVEEEDVDFWEKEFARILDGWKFVPGGRIMTMCGSNQDLSAYNCFVIDSPQDSRDGIFETLSQMAEIMSRGGGVGINLSTLRPRYAYVKGVNGRSSGSASWGSLYSFVTGLIEQGGSRRGALMLILNVWHPDIEEFISSKRQMGRITNANISVGITDDFMEAVENDADWDLVFPDTSSLFYEEFWQGDIADWKKYGREVKVHKRVKARDLWNQIIESAHASAEPGIWFIDRTNKLSNSAYYETGKLICTNPCQPGFATVATPRGIKTFDDIGVGSFIWSGSQWTQVIRKLSFGVKKVYRYHTRAGSFVGTEDHRIVSEGKKIRVKDALTLDISQVSWVHETLSHIPQVVVDGLVIGDGSYKKFTATKDQCYNRPVLYVGEKDQDYYTSAVAGFIGERYGKDTVRQVTTTVVEDELPKTYERSIPDRYLFSEDPCTVASFLRGIYSANGSVTGNRITLKSTSIDVILQVQEMLSYLGISSYYTTNKQKRSKFANGYYICKESYDLNIGNLSGRLKFYTKIGFLQHYKTLKLKQSLETKPSTKPVKVSYEIVDVEYLGEHPVYDITVDASEHTYWTGGVLVSNCGEEPLPAGGVCNLGHINLSRFVLDGDVDWDNLETTVAVAVRFLDNIIDHTPYFHEDNAFQQKSERRVGLGTLGLAEMLIRLKLRYGSEESLEFIDKLYGFIANKAYQTSALLAKEKGCFSMYDAKKFEKNSLFLSTLSDETKELVKQHGLRNVTLLTQAPTGSTGTLVDTSTGIEPFFYWKYVRKSRLGHHEQRVKVYDEWMKNRTKVSLKVSLSSDGPELEDVLPSYFVTAMDLSPEEHVRVQAAIQKWVDSAISKTCNIPSDYTVEQTRELYELMYSLGCKGGTVYRDKSRDEQVLNIEEVEEEQSKAPPPKKEEPKIREIPDVRRGITVSQNTPSGTAHITMNSDEEGVPFEVFIDIGKGGSDIKAMAEAIGRLISLVLRLRSDIPPAERANEIVNQLRHIGGRDSVGFGPNRVLSLPDAVAKVLSKHFLGVELNGNSNGNGDYKESGVSNIGDLCSACNNYGMLNTEGCSKCIYCGFSKC